MIRAVADTNIYISALMFGGLPGVLLDLAFQGLFLLITSQPLLDELEEKLSGKFALAPEDVRVVRDRLERTAALMAPDFVLDVVSQDPEDNRVLECAVAGKADVVVSGDRHLLQLGSHAGIPILTARQFLVSIGVDV